MQPDPDHLLTAAAVRERCGIVLAAAERDATPHFRLHLERLDQAAALVADITRRRYPDLRVPLHSRWRHFSAGGVDRAALLAAQETDPAEIARSRIDLAIVSVLVALYPVLTVILAATVLKERMTKLQFVAVGLVIVASLLFSSTSV